MNNKLKWIKIIKILTYDLQMSCRIYFRTAFVFAKQKFRISVSQFLLLEKMETEIVRIVFKEFHKSVTEQLEFEATMISH